MPNDNPARPWQIALTGCSLLVSGLVLALGWWAFIPVPLTASAPAPAHTGNDPANETPRLAHEQWGRLTWQPPEKKAVAKIADQPWNILVVGVLTRQGKVVAAIEPAKGQPLLFIAEGETRNDITVSRITSQEVDVQWSGEKRTIGVRP
jgi:hypothetical protein